MEKETLLIIEDDDAVAKGLVFALREEGFTPLRAESAERADDLMKEHTPKLIVLDIRLPGMNGFDYCKKLRSEGRNLPILMLTARDEETDKVLGLEIGADDYMIKPFSLRELVSRIRALLRRSYGELSRTEGSRIVRFGDVEIDTERLAVTKNGTEIELTPLEFKLLKLFIDNPKVPLSRERILESVWGSSTYYGDERTVDVHVRHLREKLENDPSKPVWIKTVRNLGYVFTVKNP
ncbi:MAG: response regulator transcription factor [Spirochaetia bacterium]